MWNSLPFSVVSTTTIEEFKAQIKFTGIEVCVLACLYLSCVHMTKICVYANFAYMQILHT